MGWGEKPHSIKQKINKQAKLKNEIPFVGVGAGERSHIQTESKQTSQAKK